MTIGLNHPEQFGYIAGSSATFRANTDLAANFAPWLAAGAPGKGKLQYVAMMTGTGEAAAIPQSKRVVDFLTGRGLQVEWTTPNGNHTWHSWRGYFRELLERKFFVENAYAAAPVAGKK